MSIFNTFLTSTGVLVSGRHGMRQPRKEIMPISRSDPGRYCVPSDKQKAFQWQQRCVSWRDRLEKDSSLSLGRRRDCPWIHVWYVEERKREINVKSEVRWLSTRRIHHSQSGQVWSSSMRLRTARRACTSIHDPSVLPSTLVGL